MKQLCSAPTGAGAYASSLFQFAQPAANDCIPGILALRYGRNRESVGILRGQIFQAVHGKINCSVEQGLFDFLCE
jgi:hypothetical protein